MGAPKLLPSWLQSSRIPSESLAGLGPLLDLSSKMLGRDAQDIICFRLPRYLLHKCSVGSHANQNRSDTSDTKSSGSHINLASTLQDLLLAET